MGQVTTLYLLPGMMCDERLFSSQVKALSTCYQCVVVSCLHGDSIEFFALDVLQRIKTDIAQSKEPVRSVLVGLSMGGIVAMECMRLAPQLIDAVVLMDTNHLAEDSTRQRLRPPQIKRVLDGELDTVLIDEMKPLYLAPINRSNELLLALVLDMAKMLGPTVFAQQSNALMNRVDSTQTLSQWGKPALVLYGAFDELCPPERHVMMHKLMQNSALIEIPNAGHLTTLEAPTMVNDALLSFLKALESVDG